MRLLTFRAVQKLYSIRDSKTLFNKNNQREVSLLQLPFFFLASGQRLSRLEIVNNGGNSFSNKKRSRRRKKLRGFQGPQEPRIVYKLPQKATEIALRPMSSGMFMRWSTEYEFDLGNCKVYIISICNLTISVKVSQLAGPLLTTLKKSASRKTE